MVIVCGKSYNGRTVKVCTVNILSLIWPRDFTMHIHCHVTSIYLCRGPLYDNTEDKYFSSVWSEICLWVCMSLLYCKLYWFYRSTDLLSMKSFYQIFPFYPCSHTEHDKAHREDIASGYHTENDDNRSAGEGEHCQTHPVAGKQPFQCVFSAPKILLIRGPIIAQWWSAGCIKNLIRLVHTNLICFTSFSQTYKESIKLFYVHDIW